MPKMKTLKSASKRFKKKPSGKIKFKQAHSRHLLANKSQQTKRAHRKRTYVSKADEGRVSIMLPYS